MTDGNKISKNIYDLRKDIELIENELVELGDPVTRYS